MPTYAIGDIQGCYRTLRRLLERVRFDGEVDRLWLTGDLVNRGPGSLEVLRWAREQGERAVTVLGNHDLHLLGRFFGTRTPKSRDTLDEVLAAPDSEELIRWLRQRPFLHREGALALVHAGFLPAWTLERAVDLAREVEGVLGGPEPERLLEALVASRAPAWRNGLEPEDRWRVAVQSFTRLRTCREDSRVCEGFSGPPERAPNGCRPWFELRDDHAAGTTVVFGHWATLGLRLEPGVMALDTGCVWGGNLTAVRLEDGALFQEPVADRVPGDMSK
jgi:bis(5'-nucleosyl)-tetraphosphatase (symmetrical)